MTTFGYGLSSEEHPPLGLVANAGRAEEAGFELALISDHFHLGDQGESPFVWSVIGGIAATTERIRVGTGVTCPTIRIHPAIVAHAAATCAAMLDGRVNTVPDPELVERYRAAGGDGPRYGPVQLCYAEDEQGARETVHRLWRLPRPSDFEAVAESVTVEQATEHVPCGPDPDAVVEAVRTWEEAGFDHVAPHQVGPDQEGFFRFWEQEPRPKLSTSG